MDELAPDPITAILDADQMDLPKLVEQLPSTTLRRWSSNNMMCVVEFEPLAAAEQDEMEDIFAIS